MKVWSVLLLHIGLFACLFLNEKQESIDFRSAAVDGSDSVLCLSKSDLRNWGINKIYDVSQYQVRGSKDYLQWEVDEFSFEKNSVWLYTTSYFWDSSFVFHIDSLGTASAGMGATFSNNFDDEGKLSSSGGSGYGAFDWREFFWVNDTMAVVETTCSGHCGGFDLHHSIRHYNSNGLLKYEVYIFREWLSKEDEENHLYTNYEMFRKDLDSLSEGIVRYDTAFYEYGKSICDTWYVATVPEARSEEFYSKFRYHQIFIGKEPMESFIQEKVGVLPKVVLMQVDAGSSCSFIFNEKAGKYF